MYYVKVETNAIGDMIQLTLSDGSKILIETFEREPGKIDISSRMGVLKISPVASNRITIESENH